MTDALPPPEVVFQASTGRGVFVTAELVEMLGANRAICYQQIRWLVFDAMYEVEHHVSDGGILWARITRDELAAFTGVSEGTVRRAVTDLIEGGLIAARTDIGDAWDQATWLAVKGAIASARNERLHANKSSASQPSKTRASSTLRNRKQKEGSDLDSDERFSLGAGNISEYNPQPVDEASPEVVAEAIAKGKNRTRRSI
jgi:hypothetical protein